MRFSERFIWAVYWCNVLVNFCQLIPTALVRRSQLWHVTIENVPFLSSLTEWRRMAVASQNDNLVGMSYDLITDAMTHNLHVKGSIKVSLIPLQKTRSWEADLLTVSDFDDFNISNHSPLNQWIPFLSKSTVKHLFAFLIEQLTKYLTVNSQVPFLRNCFDFVDGSIDNYRYLKDSTNDEYQWWSVTICPDWRTDTRIRCTVFPGGHPSI